MGTERLERLMGIVMAFFCSEKVTAAELAEDYHVTVRTIYRDFEFLSREVLPIYAIQGRKGGFALEEQYKIDKGLFTTSDIVTLLNGLFNIPLSDDDVLNAIAKIKNLVPPEFRKDVESRAGHLSVNYTSWQGDQPPLEIMGLIKDAMEQHHYVRFYYYNANGKERERTVEPYQLFLRESQWYLHGWCTDRRDYRNFRLSRMSDLSVAGEAFAPRADASAVESHNFPKPETIPVLLRVHPDLKAQFYDLAGRDNVSMGEDGWLRVRYSLQADAGEYDLLLRYGARCECLEPESVRSEIRRRVEELRNLYA